MPWELDRMELSDLMVMIEAKRGKRSRNPGASHREQAIAALEKAYAEKGR